MAQHTDQDQEFLYQQRLEQACVERCQWRNMFNELSETPVDFSYADCEEIKANTQMSSIQGECGLAAVCVAFVAKEGAL